jgi:DNA transposition AAA+ family ATPase
MKQEFIKTGNTKNFEEMCAEMMSPASLIGPSLAMVTGPAGRGKTAAAQHYVVNSDAIYLPPMNIRTPAMVLREISFDLAGMRPTRTDACLTIIGEQMARNRRLIMIDEADLLKMECLEMLRNVNERFACPIMLIGEEDLKGKVGSRRRLASRIRRRVEFGPISKEDIVFFFHTSLGIKTSADVASIIHKHANGDWRPVLTAAIAIERSMKTSNSKELTMEMVTNVIKNS